MAINSQKFLPSSKINSSTSIVKVGKMIPTLYKNAQELKSQNPSGSIVIIKKQVVDIAKIVSDNTLLRKKTQQQDKKEIEDKKREEKEGRLEKKQGNGLVKSLIGTIPQLGFLDAINRFITFTLLGWAFKRIYPHLPQIIQFIKYIEPVAKFFEVLTVNFFKSVVDFIDFGYKAYDTVRGFTKKIGGEPFQKAFDDFSKNLNTFVNLALVAGMLATGGPSFGKGGKSFSRSGSRIGGRPRITTSGGRSVGKPDIRNPLRSRSKVTGGVKGAGRFARLGRYGLPIIGGLIDFGIRTLIFKEPLDRAAAGAIGFGFGQALGSWIGGVIGTAAGTVVPIIGNILGGAAGAAVGGILGGMLGDLIGTSLLDTIKSYHNKREPIKKQAVGGKVTTRKGKVVGGKIKRTVRKVYSPPKSKTIKPGSAVGGENKLKKLFPEPPKNQIGKMMNPYGFVSNTAKRFGEIPVIGSIFNIFGKVLRGDLPTKDDYRIVGDSFNAWINNAITKGVLQGNLMSAFAEGGVIDVETQMKRDISGWVERSVEELVRTKVTEAINEMRKNLGMKPLQEVVPGQDVTDQAGELGSASDAIGGARLLMAAGFPPLAAAILSGNIQQESGWKGQRTPWVLNDGAGTNKGLISWNRTRITNAEKFLGKPLETASNAEQIKWIKEELRQYGLLDEFMNPNSTEKQLQDASYKYIVWGDLGDRWKYSKQIYAAIQRGEQGTYAPATSTPSMGRRSSGWSPSRPGLFNAIEYITGDRSHSNFELKGHGLPGNYHDHIAFKTVADKERAKRALISAGISIGSEFRPGDRGYHGLNLAIDVPGAQWGGSGAIGQKEFDGSKRVRAVLGLKDGGEISDQKVKPLQRQASYEYEETTLAILPIIIEKEVPVQTNNRFGLNRSSKYSSRVPM